MVDKCKIKELESTILQLTENQRHLEQQISDLKNENELLKESEFKFNALFYHVPLSYQSLNSESTIVDINKAWENLLGYERIEIIGKPFQKFLTKESAAKFNDKFNEFKKRGRTSDVRFRMIKKDQSILNAKFYGKIKYDSDGNVIGTHCILIDETDQIKSHNKFKRMFENIRDIYVETDLESTIKEISPSINNYFEFKREDLIGSKTDILYSNPKDRKAYLDLLHRKGFVREMEFELIDQDKQPHTFSVNGTLIEDDSGKPHKIISSLHEITSRKQHEKELKNSQKILFTVLNSIEASIYIADIDTHKILFVNDFMKNIYGNNLVGQLCHQAIRNQNSICRFCKNQQLIDKNGRPKKTISWDMFNPLNDRWYMHHDRAIKWIDERYVHFQMSVDITELKKLEKEKIDSETRLIQAEKMEAIGTLAGGIAHDLNNILTPILGFAQLAFSEAENDQLKEDLQEINIAAIRAKDLVKQILTFSRQKDAVQNVPLRVDTLLKETIKLLKSTIPSSVIIKEFIKSRATILGDPTKIHQIILNLATNAVHAMNENGVLSFFWEDIKEDVKNLDRTFKAEGYCLMTVTDTGPGIPPEIIHKIFEPYFTTKDIGKGTGLGLSIVKGIVESLGGKIEVSSETGKGTFFKIFFPIFNDKLQTETDSDVWTDLPGTEQIMLIDDEEPVLKVTQRALEKLGYKVKAISGSKQSLELFRSDPDKYDLIFSDITMPKMTGDLLAKKILEIRPDIPIILCTGFSSKISLDQAKNLGAKGYLSKPINNQKMQRMIRKLLDIKKQSKTTGSILVVNDDVQVLKLLKNALTIQGFTVETATNGKEVEQLYRDNPSDILITNIVMPEKEGLELIRGLTKDYPKVKIIAISGSHNIASESYLNMAKTFGAVETFLKPFDINELIDMVKFHLPTKSSSTN